MEYPIGEYYCKLDAKGRLLLPSSFKEQLGEAIEEGFVLRQGISVQCLELYSMADWRDIQSKLGKLNSFKRENIMLIRRFNAGARLVKIDGNGRLQLPKDLLEKSGITRDVVITALTDRMQIWDKELAEKEDGLMSDEQFAELLDAKMGDIDFNDR